MHVYGARGHGGIKKVELRSNGSSNWIQCFKSEGPSFFKCDISPPLAAPMDVRLTDTGDRQIERRDVITNLNGDATFDFGENFDLVDEFDPIGEYSKHKSNYFSI